MLKAGSSWVSYFTSKSTVTYSDSGGTEIRGLRRRSHRFESLLNPSSTLTWNAPLFPMLNVLLVVHGTVLLPPTCWVNHPMGRLPGAADSKSSWKIVVARGVPVAWVNRRTVDP